MLNSYKEDGVEFINFLYISHKIDYDTYLMLRHYNDSLIVKLNAMDDKLKTTEKKLSDISSILSEGIK